MNEKTQGQRTIGIFGATGIGVGAIVGGGILALAGVAFASTGPSAIIAFAINGAIAFLTAMVFAEMATVFPQSGGTYTFAKKVFSVESAFLVGWVVWFASIVAAVLYAIGFGFFACIVVEKIYLAMGNEVPTWVKGRMGTTGFALSATAVYLLLLLRNAGSGGKLLNIGKVFVFSLLIAAGLWALVGKSPESLQESLTPFFQKGLLGLIQAMGFSFIALQGFDLIAAVAGEIKNPAKNVPRAMFYSLGIALAIYLPLLAIITLVGMEEGISVYQASKDDPESIVAYAAQNYLGPFGYWLVIVAALLAMLSALEANLFAASRVAMSMARDRTLPEQLALRSAKTKAPSRAILATVLLVICLVLILPDVAAAGAASSLIFLLTFALAHWISVVIRTRRKHSDDDETYLAPFFPFVPAIGGLACIALACFQGITVVSAGIISASWLGLGGILFILLFAQRARVSDAASEAYDPQILRLRGKSPFVLVPIANPDSAPAMVGVADALTPRSVGRVILLSVVVVPEEWDHESNPERLENVQRVLEKSLRASLKLGVSPEALTTIAPEPWHEIIRVAKEHHCECVLLGLTRMTEETVLTPLNQLMGEIDTDVVILRADEGFQISEAKRILVPIGGKGHQDRLRARFIAGLQRTEEREITYLSVLPEDATDKDQARVRRKLQRLALVDARGEAEIRIELANDPVAAVNEISEDFDLVVLGLQRINRHQKRFGQFAVNLTKATNRPVIMISHRG